MEKALRDQLPNGNFRNTTPERSNAMRAVRGKANKTTEQRFRLALVRRKISGWKLRPAGLKGKPDFFFLGGRGIAVFVDGCFWHGCPECGHIPQTHSNFWAAKMRRNRERDERTNAELRSQGIRVFRFWEHDLVHNLDLCIQAVIDAASLLK
jgi:DNA mismatch endonuclease Vsr